jgi:Na+/proline symporter
MEETLYRAGLTTWVARIASMAFSIFLSIFAMDVFNEGQGFVSTMIALCMHLIPSFSLILLLIFSWRKEWIAGLGYFTLGLVYLYIVRNRFDWSSIAIISIPLFILGILFWISWHHRKQFKQK